MEQNSQSNTEAVFFRRNLSNSMIKHKQRVEKIEENDDVTNGRFMQEKKTNDQIRGDGLAKGYKWRCFLDLDASEIPDSGKSFFYRSLN